MSDGAIDRWTNDIHQGDCFDVLEEIPEESVHAVVTDPPYGLEFMSEEWDRPADLFEGVRGFSGDAEFGGGEGDRDLPKSYSSGRNVKCRKCERWQIFSNPCDCDEPDFPNTELSDNRQFQMWVQAWADTLIRVLKPGGWLLAFGSNRTHHRLFTGLEEGGFRVHDTITWHYGQGFPKNTDTQLKPASEFLILGRKPCRGPAKDCHEEHGTAYLGIDRGKIEGGERPTFEKTNDGESYGGDNLAGSERTGETTSEGRYPANVVFDEFAAEQLDEDVGDLSSGSREAGQYEGAGDTTYGDYADTDLPALEGNEGGPSRYFYTSKATKAERTLNGQIDNSHPTVKPQDLMEWLVKLVTAEDQIVLDPFAGTGTTCKAAKELGRRFIGIEQEPKWADVARVRCGLEPEDPSHVRPDDDQTGLEVFADGE